MTPAEAYQKYLALKLHFTTDSYDVAKYDWKTKSANYAGRKDKLQFEKLSHHVDPVGLMLANFLVDSNVWIGDILNSKHQDIYYDWKRRRDSIHYIFAEEIKSLNSESFRVIDGQHPELLKLYIKKKISPETMVILNYYTSFAKVWDIKLKDDAFWPDVSRRIAKYKGFVKYDLSKTRKIMLDKFNTKV